ncbi:MAG: molybdate ABC transporter substrate-binding protein [Pseudomonadota bacterium]
MRVLNAAMLLAVSAASHAQATLPVYAAGSLREALTEVADLWQRQGGARVTLTFGASGLLRERIEQGAPAQVFASADTEHPRRLAVEGQWLPPVVFTRNALCALVAPEVEATSGTLLATLLSGDIRLGTSTPRADPAGDYAWAFFRKAEAAQPGAYAALDAKALRLTGGAGSLAPPPNRNTYAWLMEQNKADVFLTYCTNAVASRRELPSLKVVQLPPELHVGATYGLAVRADAPPAARDFAAFVLSPAAQAVFARLGFGAP